jgi:hypothetical protein
MRGERTCVRRNALSSRHHEPTDIVANARRLGKTTLDLVDCPPRRALIDKALANSPHRELEVMPAVLVVCVSRHAGQCGPG